MAAAAGQREVLLTHPLDGGTAVSPCHLNQRDGRSGGHTRGFLS